MGREIHRAPCHSQEDSQQGEEISNLNKLEDKRRVQNHSAS